MTDHTSLLRFVEARFGLPALTHRDANAVPPFDMFDFAHPDLTVPLLPAAVVDDAQRAACAQLYPPGGVTARATRPARSATRTARP